MMNPRLPLVIIILLLVVIGLRRVHRRFGDPDLRVTFLDVGQGDAALVEFPGARTMLVDAGGGMGDFNVGKKEVVPELARRAILTVDIAFLSHPDQDHGYGFLGIFDDLKVGAFWFNRALIATSRPKPLGNQLLARAREVGATLFPLDERRIEIIDGVTVTTEAVGSEGDKTNNRSLVAKLDFAGCSVWFTGDIEKEAEADLARKWRGPATFLKVAHHGSKTSSTAVFLANAQPRVGIISVGLRNRYGHPGWEVVEGLRRGGTEVLRTDFHGYVAIRISPAGEFQCETAHGSCGTGSCPKSTKYLLDTDAKGKVRPEK